MADDPARRPPRARPVADLPLEHLEAGAEELARRWAAELVLARPLASLGRISLEEVARGAAELCRQVLRALGSDRELAALLGGEGPELGAPFSDRPAALSGARDAATVVESVESLRGVLWEALLDELAALPADRARQRLLAEVSDRLAHVCAELAAIGAARERPAAAARPARFPERPPGPRVTPEQRVAIVDERDPPSSAGEEPAELAEEQPPGRARAAVEIDEPWVSPRTTPDVARERRSPGSGREVTPVVPPADVGAAEVAIHDAREEHGPAAWIRSVGEHLERFERDGLPFAVVLMELDGAAGAEADVEGALAAELRAAGGGTLTREREGRYWLSVPRADRIGAHALAARLEHAALAAAAAAGAPSATVATGTALCPEDGRQASALAAHADIGLYAARWESGAGPRAGGERG